MKCKIFELSPDSKVSTMERINNFIGSGIKVHQVLQSQSQGASAFATYRVIMSIFYSDI